VVNGYRKAGSATTSYYDTAEGGVLAVADERVTHNKFADAIAIIRYDIELHPKSYDAQMALGAALKKSGDAAGAIVAYKKSLELNPRSTAGEKADAETAEKAIAESTGH
jgi:Flp pilus assembly protein TadD